jgi:hypothetical protein
MCGRRGPVAEEQGWQRQRGAGGRAPPHVCGPLPPSGRQQPPCGCAPSCTVLLEEVPFCAWDIFSLLLHIGGFCRCRPENC